MIKVVNYDEKIEGSIAELGDDGMVIQNYQKNNYGTLENVIIAKVDTISFPKTWDKLSKKGKISAIKKICKQLKISLNYISFELVSDC